MVIDNAPRPAAKRGAENDRIFHQDNPPGRFGAGFRRLFVRAGVDLRLRLQRRGAAPVHRRRVSPLQFRIPTIPAITACMFKLAGS